MYEDTTVADTAAYIIEYVQNFKGSSQDLLEHVALQLDNWGQVEYDQALEDYGILNYRYGSDDDE